MRGFLFYYYYEEKEEEKKEKKRARETAGRSREREQLGKGKKTEKNQPPLFPSLQLLLKTTRDKNDRSRRQPLGAVEGDCGGRGGAIKGRERACKRKRVWVPRSSKSALTVKETKSFLPLRRKEKTLFEASGKARVCVCSLFSRV